MKQCKVCGLLWVTHNDPAECMRDLMNYILPEVRETEGFKLALEAGFKAMKESLAKTPIPPELGA